MKSLEELLLLWQEGLLTQAELEQLNQLLRDPAARATVAREFDLTASLHEAARAEQAQRLTRAHADAFGTRALEQTAQEPAAVTGLAAVKAVLWRRWKIGAALASGLAALVFVLANMAGERHLARLEAPAAGVEVQRGARKLPPAQTGYWVDAGDVVNVASNSSVSLVYTKEKTRLQLQGGTRLVLAESEDGKRVELTHGALSAEVAPQAEGRPMLVTTPHALATVLGTEFALSVTPDRSKLEVLSGTVRLARREDEKSILVAAGTSATAGPGLELATHPLLQAPWQSQDIGQSARPGCARFESDGKKCHVKTHAADHPRGHDDFHFVYQILDGDGEICARVLRFGSRDRRTKAGVVIRESLRSDAVTAFLRVNAGHGLEFKRRGGTETITDVVGEESFPYWVRLVRHGNTITAYKSPDGQTWTKTGSGRFELANRIYIGLGVTSSDSTSGAAVFDNVSILSQPRDF